MTKEVQVSQVAYVRALRKKVNAKQLAKCLAEEVCPLCAEDLEIIDIAPSKDDRPEEERSIYSCKKCSYETPIGHLQ